MAAPTNWSDLVGKATGSSGTPELLWHSKQRVQVGGVVLTTIGGGLYSPWTLPGCPSHGVAPGATARIPTNSTTGALGQADASGGRKKWLVGATIHQGVFQGSAGMVILVDRLADISGLSGTSTSTQNTAALAVTRYTSTEALGNSIFLEIYTSVGSSARTATVAYTDENGNAASATATLGGTDYYGRFPHVVPVPFAQGGRGVRSVQSVTLSASTGTAGDFGVTIARPLAVIGCSTPNNVGGGQPDLIGGLDGPVEIKPGACLTYYATCTATNIAALELGLQFLES